MTALRKTLAGLDADMQAKLDAINPASIKVGAALSYLGMMIRNQKLRGSPIFGQRSG